MDEAPSCALCRRRPPGLVAAIHHHFCLACLSALGRFFRTGPVAEVTKVWRTGTSTRPDFKPASGALEQLLTEEREQQKRPPPSAAAEYSVEEVFADFKRDLDRVVKPADAATHLDLAIAYREMGLLDDALGEVALALQHGSSLTAEQAAHAVAMLLDPRLLQHGLYPALERLRGLLYRD